MRRTGLPNLEIRGTKRLDASGQPQGDNMSEKKKSNVERLAKAGVLDDKHLDDAVRKKINEIKLSDEEIKALADFKQKLGLTPLELKPGPNFTIFGSL
jgi:hypothetical protein